MTSHRLHALIDRIARLSASESWDMDLNPAQFATLDYLAHANRFSRSPSQVADYMGTTRGTASQTLKSLAKRELISETRSETDRRSVQYLVTDTGRDLVRRPRLLDRATTDASDLEQDLTRLLRDLIAERGGREFGVCGACKHHETRGDMGYCRLLETALTAEESELICHEFAA